MTNEILETAITNRRKHGDYSNLLDITEEMAGNDIRIIGHTGSFSLPPQLNDAFIKMVTDFLNKEIAALDKEYKEM